MQVWVTLVSQMKPPRAWHFRLWVLPVLLACCVRYTCMCGCAGCVPWGSTVEPTACKGHSVQVHACSCNPPLGLWPWRARCGTGVLLVGTRPPAAAPTEATAVQLTCTECMRAAASSACCTNMVCAR